MASEPPTKIELVGGGGSESGSKFSLLNLRQAFSKSSSGTGSLVVGDRVKELKVSISSYNFFLV